MKERGSTAPLFIYKPILLTTQTQTFQNLTVPFWMTLTQISQQPAAFADQFQQASAGAFVMFMQAQMLLQLLDSLIKDGNLDLSGASIAFMHRKSRHQFSFFCTF